jgi:hypothetical protein
LRVQATNSRAEFEVTTDGIGVVGHVGAALLRELADRLGSTGAPGWRAADSGRRHPDAHVLRGPHRQAGKRWELLALQTGAHYRPLKELRQFRYFILRALPKVPAVTPRSRSRRWSRLVGHSAFDGKE